MKKRIQPLEQLKDSQLLFEKEIPVFGYMLILIVGLFLAGAVTWKTTISLSVLLLLC